MIRIPDHRLVPWVVDMVLRRPRAVFAGTLIISLLAGWICSQAVVASSVGKLFFGESPKYQRYIESANHIGSDVQMLIGLDRLDPLSPEVMARLERVMERIEEMTVAAYAPALEKLMARPDGVDDFDDFDNFDDGATPEDDGQVALVRRVYGLPRAIDLRRSGDALTARTYADIVQDGPQAAREALDRFSTDPLVGGVLVSRDRDALAIVVELYSDENRPAEVLPGIAQDIATILRAEGIDDQQVHWAGMPIMVGELFRLTNYNLKTLLPVVILLLMATMFLLFRLVWPALLATFVSVIGVLWCMAFAVMLDREISIMHSIAPLVIIIVSAADVIHLVSAYLLELQAGHDKEEAIRRSASEVGRACLYTSMTTFMGFAALSFIPTPVFRQLGLVLGFGVAITLALAVTLVPPILQRLPTPTLRTAQGGQVRRFVDGFLRGSCTLSLGYPRAVIAVFCLMGGVGIYGLTQFEIENQWTGRLEADNPVVVDEAWFGERFTKGVILQMLVDSGRPGGLLEAGVLNRLSLIEADIEANEKVDTVFSLSDPLARLDREFRGGPGQVPAARKALAEYMLSLETMSRSALDGLVDFERQRAMLSIRMHSDRVRAMAHYGDDLAPEIAEKLGPGITVEPTGMLYMVGDWLSEILAGQRRGLGFSFVAIALMMTIGLGSLGVGLWSMVPNFLPLFMLGGVLGLVYDQVDSDILVLAMLAIGIGVDDTIHFLMRFRLEREAGHPPDTAIERTYVYAGRGILITTLVLAVGFSPFFTSDYWSIMILGCFLPLTLVFALLADLFLVPAMGTLGIIGFSEGDPQRS